MSGSLDPDGKERKNGMSQEGTFANRVANADQAAEEKRDRADGLKRVSGVAETEAAALIPAVEDAMQREARAAYEGAIVGKTAPPSWNMIEAEM